MPHSQAYAIAAGHPKTAQAAQEILLQGGNAHDAILAAVMMSFVAEPLLSSPGGGGFLLAAGPNQAPELLDFFSDTPGIHAPDIDKDDIDFYPIEGNFGTKSQEFHIGHAAAAVPGVPAGIYKIHQQLATMPLQQIAAPAIKAAQEGISINHQQAYVAMILQPIINATDEAKALFADFYAGNVWKNTQLATFLDTLSNESPSWFYEGQIARNITANPNGLLQMADFKTYQCQVRTPLQLSLNNHEIYTNPLPSTGGHLIAEQLQQLISNHDAAAVLEAMQHANETKRNQVAEVSRGTTHISVADSMGNLSSLTLSNGEGNGHVVQNGGFMMNNFLGEEDINNQGFFNWSSKQRMASMMAPTLIIGPENQYALGTGGSNRIKTTLFQVINHLLNHKTLLKQAIEAPRMHFENGHLDIEPGFKPNELATMKKLAPIYSEWRNHNLYFGGVNAVQAGPTTTAVADFRRNGCGITGFL